MKRLLSLLFCIAFASVGINPAWSAEGRKPKKPRPTVVVKRKAPAPKTAAIPQTAPATLPVATALPDAGETAAPTPRRMIATEPPAVAVIVISPAVPAATSPPANPYLENVAIAMKTSYGILAQNPYLQPVRYPDPTPPTFSNLKLMTLDLLPGGLGHMHPPLYVKYIEQPKSDYPMNQEKPILLFEISCPTKALFGFDTPIVYALQLGLDQVIALANTSGILPIELQKVCN